MTTIQQNLLDTLKSIPQGVDLVAVSKYNPNESIEEAYAVGQRIFGESHVQELQGKQELLPKDIEWHFIGHLQTNKVKYIVPYVALIHAVDSIKLLKEIHKQGEKIGRKIPCLIQIHVAQEDTKFGFSFQECKQFLKEGLWKELPYAQINGLMCMASNVDNDEQIRKEFHSVNLFFDEIKKEFFNNDPHFNSKSWGMSHDYKIAIQEGSNLVRIGSKIFGDRMYL